MPISNEQRCRNELVKTALAMKNGTMDILEGLRDIHALWLESGFSEDDTYYTLKYIESETEDVKKGNERIYFSQEYLEKQDNLEKEYLDSEKLFIDKLLEELSQIPILEKEEESQF